MTPNNAPRCFGLATMFGADAAICGICVCHDACGPIAKVSLARLAQEVDVGNVGSMHVSTKTPAPAPKQPGPTGKMSKMAKQILKAAPDALEQMNANQNPFTVSSKPPYLKPLVDIMLSDDDSQERLTRLLVGVFNKSPAESKKLLNQFDSAIEEISNMKKEAP